MKNKFCIFFSFSFLEYYSNIVADIYVNFAIYYKLHNNLIKLDLSSEIASSRTELFNIFDNVIFANHFDNVNQECFAEKATQTLKKKEND